jgi:hypothetical protein
MDREICIMHIKHSVLAKESLTGLWKDLGEREQAQCRQMFGRLIDLAEVPVNWDMIKAMAWFWDNERRCFVINDNDYGPLLEEYEAIFQGNRVNCRTTYTPFQKTVVTKKLARFFEVDHIDVTQEVREETRVNIKTLIVLRNRLLTKYGVGESKFKEIKLKTFALAAFGLILFPTEDKLIDSHLYDLMIGIWHAKVNPMIAVLAETVATFSTLNEKRDGWFKACPQLFQIWAMQHFLRPHNSELGRYQPNPVTATIDLEREVVREQQTIEEWKGYFRNLTEIKWNAAFMTLNSGRECLVGSGEDTWKGKTWVPLFGPWNCIGYAPQMFLRQFRSQQVACNLEGMKECKFSLWDKEGINARWKEIGKAKAVASKYESRSREFSSYYQIPSEEYLAWRNQVEVSLLDERTPRLPKRKMQSRDYIHDQMQEYLQEKEEEIAKLKEEIQGLRDVQHDVYYAESQIETLISENQQLRQEKKEAEAEREMWKRRCKGGETSSRRRIG